MKAFSPVGPAVKAFYGLGALTIGNPFGLKRAPGVVAQFTDAGDITGVAAQIRALGAGNGQVLAIDNTGQIHSSLTGGRNFLQLGNPGYIPTNLVYGDGVWILGAGGSIIARSTDEGAHWTNIDTGMIGAGAPPAIATDGAGNWIAIAYVQAGVPGATNAYAKSTDNGLTWTVPNISPNLATAESYSAPFWAGGKWNLTGPGTSGTEGLISTSVDGATWASTVVSQFQTLMGYTGSLYLSADPSGVVQAGASIAAMIAATPVQSRTALAAMIAAGGRAYLFDDAPDAAELTLNGVAFGAVSLLGQSGPAYANVAAYDAAHQTYVIGNDAGHVLWVQG